MADSNSARDDIPGWNKDENSISDTINALLQSSVDMDVAAALGLYDDPSSLAEAVMDTRGMLSGSGSSLAAVSGVTSAAQAQQVSGMESVGEATGAKNNEVVEVPVELNINTNEVGGGVSIDQLGVEHVQSSLREGEVSIASQVEALLKKMASKISGPLEESENKDSVMCNESSTVPSGSNIAVQEVNSLTPQRPTEGTGSNSLSVTSQSTNTQVFASTDGYTPPEVSSSASEVNQQLQIPLSSADNPHSRVPAVSHMDIAADPAISTTSSCSQTSDLSAATSIINAMSLFSQSLLSTLSSSMQPCFSTSTQEHSSSPLPSTSSSFPPATSTSLTQADSSTATLSTPIPPFNTSSTPDTPHSSPSVSLISTTSTPAPPSSSIHTSTSVSLSSTSTSSSSCSISIPYASIATSSKFTTSPPKPTTSNLSSTTPSTSSPIPVNSAPPSSQPLLPSSLPSSSLDTTPKGLNLPLLQFLQVNFPGLQLDSFKDIFQVNALLAHTLQQQQQMQQQIKQTAQHLQQQQQMRQLKQQIQASRSATSHGVQSGKSVGSALSNVGGKMSGAALSKLSGGARASLSAPNVKLGRGNVSAKVSGGSVKLSGGSLIPSGGVKIGGDSLTSIKLGGGSLTPGTSIKVGGRGRNPLSGGTVKLGMENATPIVNNGDTIRSKGSATPIRVSASVSATAPSLGSADSANRTPVFAQILANLKQQQSLTGSFAVGGSLSSSKASSVVIPKQSTASSSLSFTNPLLLGKQRDSIPHSLTSIPRGSSPLQKAIKSTRSSGTMTNAPKMSSRTAAKLESSQLSRTLIEYEDSEPMDLDVGQPFQLLELPKHLRDHSYSRYNPEEGERLTVSKSRSLHVPSSIPPARVSYAPQVPDSPTTLYKLLKVTPRKTSRRSSVTGGSSRTSGASRNRKSSSKRGRFTPSGGSIHGRKVRMRGVGSRGSSNPSSRGESEEPDISLSSSEQSDDDFGTSESKSNRRRSQRTAGQRKRYVDDLNIAFSDEEMHDDIMNPRPLKNKEYRGYGEEDDWEYADQPGGTPIQGFRSSKHKTKTVTVNPTEGFQYSDIYFEPPAEEANLVDKILSMRIRKAETDEEEKKYGETIEEYFIKYKNYSYLHATWAPYHKLLQGDKRFDGKAKRYKAKVNSLGVFANLDDEPFNPEYTVVDRILDVATQTETNSEVVTHYLVKWRSLPYEDATWELEEDVDMESIRKFNQLQLVPPEDELQFQPRPPPHAFRALKGIKKYKDDNELRPYQLEGVNWLLFNWYARQNCILADEMGLGKTVQSIALFLEVMKAGIRGPFLVIAPLSTITNWEREFTAWCDCNVVVYHGSAYSRRLIHEYELYYRNSEGKVIPDAFKFNVIITTYEVMLSDDSELQSIQWRVVIIDEAHRLKNRNCKLLEELKALDMEHRVLLTGTPLQNSVEELFSLLNFLEPSTFPSHVAFLQQFGDLKTEEQVEELKSILKPMMLRRLKEDVEKSLAPKEETIVEVELTVIQKQYYRAILERNFTFLSKGSTSNVAVPSLLNVMMELRKCCNHPYLIQGAELQIVEDYQIRHPQERISNALIQASGKMVLIDKLLARLKESGHKVLIFSQMVRCLDILEDYLRLKGYFYERIDGNVRGIHRQEAIDRFSKPNSDRFVFLLCTRAGGLGINLTAADTVIIYDSDWNPQNDLQAQARCHRIGQNKSVKIYRLITHNTYERDMFDRASLKLGLDKAVLQSMQQSTSTGNTAPQLSKKEIEDLLKKGAYGAIMDEDDDANKFCEEDIDQILERRAHVIQLESEGKGSTFSKASFVADGSSDINVDDPEFWQKWAAKANLDLDELANKDSLVLDTPRLRRQVRRYGNDSIEEIVEMNEAIDEVLDVIPSVGKRGWTKLECLKVEKGLLVYGWREWKSIARYGKFRKRKLGRRDVENVARNILIYCLAHFTGDDKVPPYIWHLLDPSIMTESAPDEGENFYYDFSPEDFQILQEKDPETLFQDITYRKHLRRHSNKILLRVRQLHVMRWSMFIDHMDKIKKGVPAKSLGLDLPRPDEPPPAPWWNLDCDHSLLVGIIKHGYEQFGLMRSDPALCFKAMCGEEPPGSKKKRKSLAKEALAAAKAAGSVGVANTGNTFKPHYSDISDSGEESEGVDSEASAPSTPSAKRMTRSSTTNTPISIQYKIGGFYVWPSLAEVNTRARRYVSAWIRQLKREESKQAHLLKEREKREKFAEASRKKEQKKAELAQKWSKREEQDFARVISFFGVEFNNKINKYDWIKFRQLGNLSKKSDERLTLYLHDFKQMCWRVLKKKKVKIGLSGMRVEPITEEKASRCLQRINLLSTIREEILPHDEFDELIKLCEVSFEVPQWWLPGTHDADLLRGVSKHGIYRSDQLIYGDPELSFKETVPQTALFDTTINQTVQSYSEGSEDEQDREEGEDGEGEGTSAGGSKVRSSGLVVPLGWPKEKAIIIRMTRIVYAFRNKVWPKPMEGLDLFVPTVQPDESSSDSSPEEIDDFVSEGNDSDYHVSFSVPTEKKKRPRRVKGLMVGDDDEDSIIDIEGSEVRDFEIERSQGLKLTLKKTTQPPKKQEEQLEIKIPLVQLSFASSAGLKRIPKKRPAAEGSPTPGAPEAKKKKQDPKSSYFKMVDPKEVSFTDLTGHERVGVINRNTDEKLPLRQSPMLKNLRLWLDGHPHFNVEPDWGALVIEWGALKPEMYNRILQASSSQTDTSESNSAAAAATPETDKPQDLLRLTPFSDS